MTGHRFSTGVITNVDNATQTVTIQCVGCDDLILPVKDIAPQTPTEWVGGCQVSIVDIASDRFIILEPDHVLDVTEVVECIMPTTSLPDLAILRRFAPRGTNLAAIVGMAVNTAFDLLVQRPTLSDADLLRESLKDKTLAIASLLPSGIPPGVSSAKADDKNLLPSALADGPQTPIPSASADGTAVTQKVTALFPAVRLMRQRWADASIRVEPHVIAPSIGLQGRFDILVTEHGATDLVEMKAGSPPSNMRTNHAAQVAAYALMYELMHGKAPNATQLWYVAAETSPLRDVPDVRGLQHRVIATRNAIVVRQRRLARRQFDVLRGFTGTSLQAAGPSAAFEQDFATAYRQADLVSRTAAQAWMSFLQNEQWEQRAGADTGRTASSMWRMTLDEKLAASHVVGGLVLDADATDVESMRLAFRTSQPVVDKSIRIGDMVVVRPQLDHHRMATVEMFKGTVREISDDTITVSLRNKHIHADDLAHTVWMIEPDVTDAGLRQQWASIMRFLNAPIHRRHLLLGLLPPSVPPIVPPRVPSSDYRLVQGPPGTGKTSTVLRDFVRQLINDPSERLLVLAYTNRAVNEICDVLDNALPHGSYLRHGTRTGIAAHHEDIAIPILANHLAPYQLRERIEQARCIVSTVQSIHSGSEIMTFGGFTTLILDEASQVLEPQIIGTLAQVERFIMIGDHLQLPAVVTQPAENLRVDSDVLAPIHLTSLGMSMFERLIRCAEAHGWTQAFTTLTAQGRMHRDIMRFASDAFYGGRLTTIAPWQEDPTPLPWHDILPGRAIFRAVTAPGRQAEAEAQEIVRLTTQIFDHLDDQGADLTLGIITPFRVQNRRIDTLLPHHLRGRVTVDTVERFQGSQRDIIIYGTAVGDAQELSAIRADIQTPHGIVDRKLNVAATRARHQFVLVGDPHTLRISPPYQLAMDMLICA